LKLEINRLLFHIPPRINESIGSWIEELAKSNNVQFNTMYWHIMSHAQRVGLFQTLHALTGISTNHISRLTNEFEPEFWRDLKRCPLKNCDYNAKNPLDIVAHLQTQHNLGTNLSKCPFCDHQVLQKRPALLVKHIKIMHGTELRWWNKCPYCDYEPIQKIFLIHHLIIDHHVKLTLFDCVYCDHLAENELNLKFHLWKFHGIKEEYPCQYCEYISKNYFDLISHLRAEHTPDKHSLKEKLCPFCDYKCKNKTLLEQHLWIKHELGGKWYICPDLGCSFKSKHHSSYIRHLKRTSHGVLIKQYKKYNILKIDNKYKCPQCSMESQQRKKVRNHLIRVHTSIISG